MGKRIELKATVGERGALTAEASSGSVRIDVEELIDLSPEEYKAAQENEKKAKSEKKKSGTYKRSAHLTEQSLKYTYPKDGVEDLFSALVDEEVKERILAEGAREGIAEGIKLNPAETKVIDALCKLLHHKSQNHDPKEKNYYTGNEGNIVDKIRNSKGITAPALCFTLYEFTKEYKGGDVPSGKDLENVGSILRELSEKRFLIRYKETISKKGGFKTVNEIESFEKIINLPTARQTQLDPTGKELSKQEQTLIILHPIFRSQIDSKFIIYPDDIVQRTILAYGSPNVSGPTLKLRDYLLSELSAKRYSPKIALHRLYYKLNEKWMREGRKKRVKEFTDIALETVKRLGLLLDYKIEPSKANGELIVIFSLNKDFL